MRRRTGLTGWGRNRKLFAAAVTTALLLGGSSSTVAFAALQDPVAAPTEQTAQETSTDAAPQATETPAPSPAPASESSGSSESVAALAAENDVPIVPFAEGEGPDAGQLNEIDTNAANPDTYTNATLADADSSDVVQSLTSQTRIFTCGDTIVYFYRFTVDPDAFSGQSDVLVHMEFETQFNNADRIGITSVEALLATDDSNFSTNGNETISTLVELAVPTLDTISTITGVEAGESFVIEFRALLTCGEPYVEPTGNLHMGHVASLVSTNAGTDPPVSWGGGTDSVPLFADAVRVSVVPALPGVTQATCTPAGPTTPSLTVPDDTEFIDYSVSAPPPYAPGDTVTITASLQTTWITWGTLPDGWTIDPASGDAVYVVEFDDIVCEALVPADPVVFQAQCLTRVPVPPLIVVPDTPGVTYTLDPADYTDGDTVTVTATLDDPTTSHWGDLPDGWTFDADGNPTFTVELVEVPCAEVLPVDPAVVQAQCTPTGLTAPTVTPAETPGVTYTVSPDPVVAGQEFTVVATLDIPENTFWGPMPEGWIRDGDTAVYTGTLDDVSCPPPPGPTPPPGPAPDPQPSPGPATLPATGLDPQLLSGAAIVGSLLLLGGLGLLVRPRRRH